MTDLQQEHVQDVQEHRGESGMPIKGKVGCSSKERARHSVKCAS